MTTTNKAKLSTEARLRKAFIANFGKDAEQFQVDATLRKVKDGILATKHLPSGKARLRDPETGEALKMAGDIGRFGPIFEDTILALWWLFDGKGEWVPVPSTDALMEWSFDSVCETPDGRSVEPDHPDSWLRLLGLV
jgi:hypothetical protein